MKNNQTYGYIRVSTTDQADNGYSLQMQKDRIIAYCLMKGYSQPTFFSDEGISGKKSSNRPALQQVLETAKEGDTILVFSLSRFARNTVETLRLVNELTSRKVNFVSLSEEVNTGSASGKFFLTVLAALAELESAQLGERTKSVLQNKKSRTETFSATPFGLKVEGRVIDEKGKVVCGGRLVPHETQADIVREIFKRGTYPSEIENFLNNNGFKPQRAEKFSRTAVVKILNNKELYQKTGVI